MAKWTPEERAEYERYYNRTSYIAGIVCVCLWVALFILWIKL